MNQAEVQPASKSIPQLLFSLLLSGVVAFFGGMFGQGEWYASINKPELTPPSWLFGPVWTILYIMIAISLWLVLRTEAPKREKRIALTLFGLQLLLNALWSWIFFGRQQLGLALGEIIAMNVAIFATILLFYTINRKASWLLIPYWLWVSFATWLTWAIWDLNR